MVTVTGAAACSGGSGGAQGNPSGTAKQITVAISDSPSATALKKVAPAFTAQTGVEVKFVSLPYAQLAAKVLLSSKKSSSAFDVIQFDSPMLASLAAGGALKDIQSQVSSSSTYDVSDFPQPVQDYAKYQGKTYAVPLSTEPYVLWYRTDLFKKLNLSTPQTWNQYLANAKALKAGGHEGSDSGFGAQIGAYYWLEAIYASGGSLFHKGTCKPALDTPQAVAATKAYLEALPYTPATAINGGGNEMTTAFVQSDVGQMINATGYYSIMNDPKQSKIPGKFAAALPPSLTGKPATLLFGWLIGVGQQSQAQQTAWQFLDFALGKSGMKKMIAAGAPPTGRTSLVDNPKLTKSLPYLPTLVDASKVGTHLPYITQMPEIITSMSADLNAAAAKKQSPAQLIKAATADVTKVVGNATDCE
ncbi:extracellular solute-binding protein [Segeticoccus rhizosphaerae]|uniref:extracellular solute-binding protein n=1 Tax=Segeticoccus rhizosphaerae TaxID=1104777 RepID=UPI001396AEF6|nr:extracellular solute-binding protein [Segeticoccus rhizosphaerae]